MAIMHQYDYIFAIAVIFTFLDAWNIGANDVANSFATSVSSRSLTLKQAMMLASFCEFGGSVIVGTRVADTIRTKIIDPHYYDAKPEVLLLAMMCTIVASSTFLTFATRYGMPVSTTHSVIGGLVGAATASVGIDKVNWGIHGVSQVFAAWVVAPGIAGVLGAFLFLFTKFMILKEEAAVRRAYFSIPFYTFITVGAIAMLVSWKGVKVKHEDSIGLIMSIIGPAIGVVVLQAWFIMPYLWIRIFREDWTLRWYHCVLGPFLFRRPPPPPTPFGYVKPQIKDYYRGHLTADELAYVRASESLLQSVQTPNNEPPNMDNSKDTEDIVLPLPAITHTPEPTPRIDRRDSRRDSVGLIPPRPDGPWNSWTVVGWRINRFLLRGVEKDVIGMQNRNAVLKWDLEDMHSRASHYDNRAEYMYSALQILTAAAASFTHGANDVANAIAPFTTAYEVWHRGTILDMQHVPTWILCFGGGAIVLGLWTFGYHVMRTLGNRLTLISPSRGFCMEMASAITVLLATRLKLPVSTTQCITGATVGVGLANGDWRCINPKLVGWIYLGWVITVPVTALIAGLLMGFVLNAPKW